MSKRKYIFGPVPSRRLGISLGVDLVPFKTCSMDCVYCECGRTTNLTEERKEYVPTDEVIRELDELLSTSPKLDYITFSGAGEPTLHSGIGAIVKFIKGKYPQYRICLLTNAGLMGNEKLSGEIAGVDLVVPSLDAATEAEFEKINRPVPSLTVQSLIDGLVKFRARSKAAIWLEIFIVPGINDSKESIAAFAEAIRRIAPDKVQLNGLDRSEAEVWVKVPDAETASRFTEAFSGLGIPVEVIGKFHHNGAQRSPGEEALGKILELVSRRPCTLDDIAAIIPLGRGVLRQHLHSLEKNGKIRTNPEN